MSKIYKVKEVDALPDISEAEWGVLYVVPKMARFQRQKIMAYKASGPRPNYVYLNSHRWLYLERKSTVGSTLPSIDITDYYEHFEEFLCVYTFNASASYPVSVEVVIPTDNQTPMASDRQDYMVGYYYDSNYNGSILFRLVDDSNGYKIQIVKGFTKITGNGTTGDETLTIYAR